MSEVRARPLCGCRVSELIETYRGVVYPWHCDHMGHMNVMWYTGKFDEATWGLFSLVGITPTYLRERERGMAAVQQNITYKREVEAGTVLVIRSAILEVRDKVMCFTHEMVDSETREVVATSELTAVHFDRKVRKACPLPADAVELARSLLGAAPP